MANTIRIKRRSSGGATGAPSSLENAELAYNEADDTLYYGKGTGGAGGSATSVEAIAGSGAYVTKGTTQTISGNKTFSGTISVPTPSSNAHAATKAYVDSAISGVTGSITLAGDSGSNQTISLSDTLTIAGGTGIDTVAGATDTLTINIDSTVATLTGTQTLTNKTLTSPTVSGLYLSDYSIVFEGSTADAYETTLSVTNPTADRTISFPDNDGTVALNGSISLGAHTVGSYVDSLVAGTGVTVTNNSGEGATPTVAIGQAVATSDSPTFAGLNLNGNIIFEGATADAYETTLTVVDPTADRTITLPNATDTLVGKATTDTLTNKTFDTAGSGNHLSINGNEITSYVGSGANVVLSSSPTITNLYASGFNILDSSIVFEGATNDAYETTLTVTDPTADRTITLPNASGTVALLGTIALATDTTGDYVASLVAGTGVSLSNNSGENATPTISIGQAVGTSADVTFATITTTGNGSVGGNLTVTGNLTVNGTTTTVNSTTITVDDKNIELGSVSSPSDAGADGGGITLKGTTDKTFNWVDATDAWTSSEHINLATGKAYYINGTSVLSGTTLGSGITSSSLTSVGTIGTGVWQGTAVAVAYGGTGATDASTARSNLGLAIGTNVQAYSSTLAAVAGGTYTGATSITTLGTIGTGTWQGTAVGVSYGGTGATSASSARSNLGLAIGSDVQAYSSTLAAVVAGTYTGSTSITTVGTISTGTWSATIDGTTIDGGTF